MTGGSYGGYLTNWIIGKSQRFKAALTCRSCVDMRTLFYTGDISGGEWASIEFGKVPWEDDALLLGDLAARRSPRTCTRRCSSSTRTSPATC